MDDFSKTKAAFAAGLLAVLLTASPAVSDYFDRGLILFGQFVSFRLLFWSTTGILAVSVYASSIRLLSQNPWPRTEFIANSAYALALVLPPTVLVLAAVSQLGRWLAPLLRSPITGHILTSLLSAIATLFSVGAWYRTAKILRKKTEESSARQLEREEGGTFTRAEDLFRQGHYDLAVIDSFRSLEIAARRVLTARRQLVFGPRVESPVQSLKRSGLLPQELLRELEFVQSRRNIAAHSIELTLREDAERALASTSRLLAFLSDTEGPQSKGAA